MQTNAGPISCFTTIKLKHNWSKYNTEYFKLLYIQNFLPLNSDQLVAITIGAGQRALLLTVSCCIIPHCRNVGVIISNFNHKIISVFELCFCSVVLSIKLDCFYPVKILTLLSTLSSLLAYTTVTRCITVPLITASTNLSFFSYFKYLLIHLACHYYFIDSTFSNLSCLYDHVNYFVTLNSAI